MTQIGEKKFMEDTQREAKFSREYLKARALDGGSPSAVCFGMIGFCAGVLGEAARNAGGEAAIGALRAYLLQFMADNFDNVDGDG